MRKEKWSYESKYLIFYWGLNFEISYGICGYFDNRPRIHLRLFFFSLTLIFPFRNKWINECDAPKWGIAYHNQTFWIYRGGKGNMKGGSKWWAFSMPWQYDWVRTSILRKDGTWEHEIKSHTKNFYEDKWKDVLDIQTFPYTYTLKSGEIQSRLATIKIREMEHRQLWLKWTSFNNLIRKSIEIDFNDEVGEETGSWKGGCTGCSYELRNTETPLESLRRMEKERKF